MTTEGFKRKLTTIFSADVAGYSRLMGEDEAQTVKTLTGYREIMAELIKQHRGRVVDSPGDNLLAEFTSVVDAVQCAVSVQKELQARNAELPEERRMEFRIGVNLGDVIEEGDRIYGDGVNIAARLEALADPGGICISKTAFDHIETKLPLGYEYLGEQTVKNIAKPVGAYRVLMEPRVTVAEIGEEEKAWPVRRKAIFAGALAALILAIAVGIWQFHLRPTPSVGVASVEKMAFPLPDDPSIAVMPFENLSGDPEQEYFSDGLTISIITGLYKIPNMFVIHRASSFAYKGKKVKVQQVAEDLGVRYVLEGSVQRAGDRIRLNVQLIDAVKGKHLWAESYDRELKNVLDVQDEIARKAVTEMAVKISWGEQARGWTRMTESHEAIDLYYEADKLFMRFEKESNFRSRELMIKAIELDPKFARAIAFLGWTHLNDVRYGWAKNPTESLMRAEELANRALAINDTCYLAHALLSRIYGFKRLHEQAIAAANRAVEAEPNNATAINVLAGTMIFAGRPEEGLVLMKKAMRLSPHPPLYFLPFAVYANYLSGRYEEAITQCKKFLKRQQHGAMARILWQFLITSYMELGREEEARTEAQKLLEQHPDFSIEGYAKAIKRIPFKDYAFLDHQIEVLREAGLPDKPPLALPDKPSIAVLAFTNMSEDPKQEFFSDGITEEIITALSKVPQLFVIARHSTFTYKGKPVKVQQVGRELGVRYVLEGSVRKADDRVRITAQLVDASTGNHLWAERYDREVKDIFAVQDEITKKILTALEVKLTEGEQARLYGKGTNNVEAYLKYLQASEYFNRFTRENNALARQMVEEAIALDPGFPKAYTILGWTHMMDARYGWSKSRRGSMDRAFKLAQKALALDDTKQIPRLLLSYIYRQKRQYEKSIAELKTAIELNPNWASAHAHLAGRLFAVGRGEEAIASAKRAIRLNPMPPGYYFHWLGQGHWVMGQYEEAIEAYKKALHRQEHMVPAQIALTASYSLLGRDEEAHAEAAEVLRIYPNFSLEYYSKGLPFRNQADTERFVNALRKAGLK